MDNRKMLSIIVIFFVVLSSLANGTEHVVGDYYGWTLGFNYTAWAEHKEFRVGDTLVFNYQMGKHNVYKVGGPDFLACSIPAGAQALTTGKDVISLATPGKKWYLCGVAKHCGLGMKLVIDVQPTKTNWNAPAPAVVANGSKTFIVGDDKGWRSYFDYNNWAKGKVFRVGDVLLFKYSPGSHNVFKVDGANFKACTSPANAEALTTGNDMITLATPGRKWYICGVSNHCRTGQKLFINVLPSLKALAPSPPPPPPSVTPSAGKIHIVGDYSGWTLNFNYVAWAQGKEFRVGDKLVFRYPVGKHNVYKVGGPDFQRCSVPLNTVAMTTGYDAISLQTPGRKWYLCGVGNGKHCQYGMRLVIDVLPAMSQPPSHHY